MPHYRFELLTGGKDNASIEQMEWVDAADDQTAKREARAWASAHPAVLTKATRVRVRSQDKIEIWSASITGEPDAEGPRGEKRSTDVIGAVVKVKRIKTHGPYKLSQPKLSINEL